MKRFFIVISLLFCVTVARAEERANYFGLGVIMSSSPYKKGDTTVMPVPAFSWKSKDGKFFIEGKDLGYQAVKYQDFRLEAILRPRLMGYDDKDASILNGMKDRKMSLDAGLKFIWNIPDSGNTALSLGFVADTLSVYQGVEAEAAVSKRFKGEIFVLRPRLGVRWQSENLTDYYYGVQSSEATGNRPMYRAHSSLNYFSDIAFYLGLHKDWVLTTMLGYEHLGDEITKSPIVGKHYQLTAILGIVRKF